MDTQYEVLTKSKEVIDHKTGLIWRSKFEQRPDKISLNSLVSHGESLHSKNYLV